MKLTEKRYYRIERGLGGEIIIIHRTRCRMNQAFHPNEPWRLLTWKLKRVPKYIRPVVIQLMEKWWLAHEN